MWDRLRGWRGEEGDEGRGREDGWGSTEESKRVSKGGGRRIGMGGEKEGKEEDRRGERDSQVERMIGEGMENEGQLKLKLIEDCSIAHVRVILKSKLCLLTFICLWTLIEDTTRTKLKPYILKKCLVKEEREGGRREREGGEREGGEREGGEREGAEREGGEGGRREGGREERGGRREGGRREGGRREGGRREREKGGKERYSYSLPNHTLTVCSGVV